jgi:hypothetical protein
MSHHITSELLQLSSFLQSNQVRKFNSVSDIKQNQYLSLRVLIVTRLDIDQAEIGDLGLGAAYTDAAMARRIHPIYKLYPVSPFQRINPNLASGGYGK